jgi:hypothetical protein
MALRLGDGKADRHDIEERRLGERDMPASIIIRDRKQDFVLADRNRPPGNQRRVGAPVGIGLDAERSIRGSSWPDNSRSASRRPPAGRPA